MRDAARSAISRSTGSSSADESADDAPRELTGASELVEFALELAKSVDSSLTSGLVAYRLARSIEGSFSAVYLADVQGTLVIQGRAGSTAPPRLQPPPAFVRTAFSNGRVQLAEKVEIADAFPHLAQPALVAAVPISSWEGRFGAVLVGAPTVGGGDRATLRFVSAVADLAAASLASTQRLRDSSAEARRDVLTGLGNQRAFQEYVDTALEEAAAGGREVTLVLFDLDDFKQINDREGHLVGDRVLREVARLTLGALRVGEEAFRMGGEEFAIVVEGGRDDGKRVAERVRKTLAGKRRGHGVPTLSAGVAGFPADAESKEELIHKADLALYAAKERGKNMAVSYHERLDAETHSVHVEVHRRREEEWWQKVLGLHPTKKTLADEFGPGSRPQEVAILAERVGARFGLSEHELRAVGLAAFLTELGKLRIPESIRRKHGPLNERDWRTIRESAELMASTLTPIAYLGDVLEIVRGCRERWDGNGYPNGLAGEATPLGARIVAVCDAYCAMTSGRTYRPARTRTRAILELKVHSGTHFDPACVRALLDVLGEAGEAAIPAGGAEPALAAAS